MKTINLISLALSLIFKESSAEKIDKSVLKEKWIEYQHRPHIERDLQARIIGGSDAPNGAYVSFGRSFEMKQLLNVECKYVFTLFTKHCFILMI